MQENINSVLTYMMLKHRILSIKEIITLTQCVLAIIPATTHCVWAFYIGKCRNSNAHKM